MLTRAVTELEAANGALGHLAEAQLTSLDENRLAARVVKKAFGGVRDALLRKNRWNFARAQAVLAADPAASPGPFAYAFPLPADCVRVLEVESLEQDAWEVAAADGGQNATPLTNVLYCGLSMPTIIYNRRVPHVALWDALFLEVFELELAARIGPSLGKSAAEAEGLATRAERKLATARRVDEREKARSAVLTQVSFVSVRA